MIIINVKILLDYYRILLRCLSIWVICKIDIVNIFFNCVFCDSIDFICCNKSSEYWGCYGYFCIRC